MYYQRAFSKIAAAISLSTDDHTDKFRQLILDRLVAPYHYTILDF